MSNKAYDEKPFQLRHSYNKPYAISWNHVQS